MQAIKIFLRNTVLSLGLLLMELIYGNDTSQLLKRLKKDQHEIVETIDLALSHS